MRHGIELAPTGRASSRQPREPARGRTRPPRRSLPTSRARSFGWPPRPTVAPARRAGPRPGRPRPGAARRVRDRSSRSTSGIPPTPVATTGRPLASASRTTFGVPSAQLGSVSTSHAPIQAATSVGGRAPRTSAPPSPQRATRARTSADATPSPTSARVAWGMRARRRSNASRSSPIPFCGSRRPTKSTMRASSATPSSRRAARRSRG